MKAIRKIKFLSQEESDPSKGIKLGIYLISIIKISQILDNTAIMKCMAFYCETGWLLVGSIQQESNVLSMVRIHRTKLEHTENYMQFMRGTINSRPEFAIMYYRALAN